MKHLIIFLAILLPGLYLVDQWAIKLREPKEVPVKPALVDSTKYYEEKVKAYIMLDSISKARQLQEARTLVLRYRISKEIYINARHRYESYSGEFVAKRWEEYQRALLIYLKDKDKLQETLTKYNLELTYE